MNENGIEKWKQLRLCCLPVNHESRPQFSLSKNQRDSVSMHVLVQRTSVLLEPFPHIDVFIQTDKILTGTKPLLQARSCYQKTRWFSPSTC